MSTIFIIVYLLYFISLIHHYLYLLLLICMIIDIIGNKFQLFRIWYTWHRLKILCECDCEHMKYVMKNIQENDICCCWSQFEAERNNVKLKEFIENIITWYLWTEILNLPIARKPVTNSYHWQKTQNKNWKYFHMPIRVNQTNNNTKRRKAKNNNNKWETIS